MANQLDVEKVISFLKEEKGVALNDMMAKVGVEREGFLSWRRSTSPARRSNLAQKLKEAYPEHFKSEDQAETIGITGKGIEERYIAYLEKEIERLRLENEKLIMIIEKKVNDMTARFEGN